MTVLTSGEELWYHRLGHASVESIRELAQKQFVSGLDLSRPHVASNSCDDCMKGKQRKKSMKYKHIRAAAVGDVIHSDLCGPMSVESFGGSRYYVSFIDEYSGFVTIVPIAKKSDVAESFKKYYAWIERKCNCTVKQLHCDGGANTGLWWAIWNRKASNWI